MRSQHEADFFSFGTNDLTQLTFGYCRDAAERGFLMKYIDDGVLPANPFQTLDDGVGRLMAIAVDERTRREARLGLGICGEHGGDPDRSRNASSSDSITFRARRFACPSHASPLHARALQRPDTPESTRGNRTTVH